MIHSNKIAMMCINTGYIEVNVLLNHYCKIREKNQTSRVSKLIQNLEFF